jgi:hypothetical protein
LRSKFYFDTIFSTRPRQKEQAESLALGAGPGDWRGLHNDWITRIPVLRCLVGDDSQRDARVSLYRFRTGPPVSFQDLAGKKFCWDSGRWVLYGANGQFLNNRGTRGTWVVLDRGVVEWRDEIKPGEYRSGRYGQWEVLSDGRLHSYSYCLLCTWHDHDHWATPCN